MSLDQRVKCLVATLRQWAADLTSAPPGARLTNYALMMLVLFYLQTLDRPVLPSIGELMDAAGAFEFRSRLSLTLSVFYEHSRF